MSCIVGVAHESSARAAYGIDTEVERHGCDGYARLFEFLVNGFGRHVTCLVLRYSNRIQRRVRYTILIEVEVHIAIGIEVGSESIDEEIGASLEPDGVGDLYIERQCSKLADIVFTITIVIGVRRLVASAISVGEDTSCTSKEHYAQKIYLIESFHYRGCYISLSISHFLHPYLDCLFAWYRIPIYFVFVL